MRRYFIINMDIDGLKWNKGTKYIILPVTLLNNCQICNIFLSWHVPYILRKVTMKREDLFEHTSFIKHQISLCKSFHQSAFTVKREKTFSILFLFGHLDISFNNLPKLSSYSTFLSEFSRINNIWHPICHNSSYSKWIWALLAGQGISIIQGHQKNLVNLFIGRFLSIS